MNAPIGNNASKSPIRHFIDLDRLDAATLREILDLGHDLKKGGVLSGVQKPFAGKTLAMIFEKPSTRTRISFEVAMTQLGGHVVALNGQDSQLGQGETIADTARVLSRYVDVIMIRTDDPKKVNDLALHSTAPVINGLTDETHPCQLMADVMTFEEHRGPIEGRRFAWCGDGNNMAASWIQAAVRFNFSLRLACPALLSPAPALLKWAKAEGGDVKMAANPADAAKGADCVITDTWVSMGHTEAKKRHRLLKPYRVDVKLMALADKNALFMHCLPAHRGDEVESEVIDGPSSVVWDEAENRLHAQKGILAWCLG